MPASKTPRCFSSTDGGKNWKELSGLRGHGTGPKWQPGAGGMCLHTIILDPSDPDRIYIAISAAGAFRTDDGGKSWKPINKGLYSKYIPNPTAEVGHCVHHIAMNPKRPGVLFMQKHWDVMRSDNAGDQWTKISGNLPTDFGFVIDIHAHEPETIYVVPIKSDGEHYRHEGKLRVFRSSTGGNEWEPLTKGLPQKDCYVNVLRDAMAVDTLDECGIYFGTTGGQVYVSPDAGDQLEADRARLAGGAVGGSADAGVNPRLNELVACKSRRAPTDRLTIEEERPFSAAFRVYESRALALDILRPRSESIPTSPYACRTESEAVTKKK